MQWFVREAAAAAAAAAALRIKPPVSLALSLLGSVADRPDAKSQSQSFAA
jgi:hypothetical protein